MIKFLLWLLNKINGIFNTREADEDAGPLPKEGAPGQAEGLSVGPSAKEKKMSSSPADTLVTQFPDRISQLNGPVYDYLKKGIPYTSAPQDLYMQVFYPAARKWDPSQQFSASVQNVNPGITCPQDYVDKVGAAIGPVLSTAEEAALQSVAGKLGVTRDSLYSLIAFESSWNPAATNPYSGARGLIQFMPATAAWMGYAAGVSGILLLALAAGLYFIARKYHYI